MTAHPSTRALKMPFVPELDGVRAVAVLIVFASHAGFGKLVPGGLGVTIFFFLSGYLITSLLRAEVATTGRVDLPAFYLRRTLRIFPPLYITMLLSGILVATGVLHSTVDAGSVVTQAAFVSNYGRLFGLEKGLPGMPLWSLAVEEHFYLLFPVIFGLLSRRYPPARIAALCAAACVVPLLLRFVHAWAGQIEVNYFFTHTRVDSILFGCVLALWQNPILDRGTAWSPGRVQAAVAAIALLTVTAWRGKLFEETLRYTLQGLSLFVLFAWVLQRDVIASRFLTGAPAQWIGRFSYTFYLSHVMFIDVLRARHTPSPLVVAGAFVATVAYAALMYVLVEKPLTAMRRRLHHGEVAPDFDPTEVGTATATT